MQSQKIKQTATEEDAGCGPLASAHTRVGACTSKCTHAQRKQRLRVSLSLKLPTPNLILQTCEELLLQGTYLFTESSF